MGRIDLLHLENKPTTLHKQISVANESRRIDWHEPGERFVVELAGVDNVSAQV